MRIVIPGGKGQIGQILKRHWDQQGHDVHLLTRSPDAKASNEHYWDGATLGAWTALIDGADIVLNLAGKSVNCRYTEDNLKEMMNSRVNSTRVVGQAILQAERPPKVWLQMSTATIYSHRYDAPNDEGHGQIGGNEPDAPAYWKRSIEIAQRWEETLLETETPHTRKVALRSAMVMSPDKGGVFDVLSKLTRTGLGGPIGGGRQYVSWIHDLDFSRALDWIIQNEQLSRAINLCAPNPLPQREFMRELRSTWGVRLGLPATKLMAEIGAWFMRTDTELVLKSRRVVPCRLLDSGFKFEYPDWSDAATELVLRNRNKEVRSSSYSTDSSN